MWLANLGREPVGAGQRHVPGGNECQNTVWGCFWCNHALASDPVALITNSRYRMTLGGLMCQATDYTSKSRSGNTARHALS